MQQTRPMAVDDLYELPDDGHHYELVAGLLVAEPPPGGQHGWTTATVARLLGTHAHERRLGVVLAGDTGFVLHRNPDTVRGPDVAFLSRERYEALEDPARPIPGPPDLAVEVLSPSNRPEEMHAKVADYLAAGTRVVWVLAPVTQQVTAYRELLAPMTLGPADELAAEDVLPGFRVKVGALFEI